MSEPLFSIVMVTLNCAEDAVRTAQSVLEQRYTDYEYIIKDGGSTDGTAERLRELGLQVHGSPDTGVYNAMNQALALCTGRYVCFMNAGDLFTGPETLEVVARWMKRHDNLDFVYGDVRSYSEHPFLRAGDDKEMREIQYPDRLSRFYLFRRMICHQAWFVRRTLYQERGGLNERYKLLADYDFLMNIFSGKGVRYSHVPATTAVFQGGGVSERQAAVAKAERADIQNRAFNQLERIIYGAAYKRVAGMIRDLLYRQIYPRLSPAARRRLNGS